VPRASGVARASGRRHRPSNRRGSPSSCQWIVQPPKAARGSTPEDRRSSARANVASICCSTTARSVKKKHSNQQKS
jgi:hypothetical protein